MNRFLNFVLAAPLLCLLPASVCWADTEQKTQDEQQRAYVRLQRDADGEPTALQTAIVRMAPAGGGDNEACVDLVGAIHIGDKSYYDELNRRFRQYDAVLYELVAREDANVPEPGQGPSGMIGGMQGGMSSLLELEHQLDRVDYKPANMVHADMSPEEFKETMRKRNESFLGMFFRMMGRGMAEQADDPLGGDDWKLMAALFAPDRAYQLKRVMAEEFSDLDGQMGAFDGPEGSTIITERNKKALEVLRRELGAGKKKVAVFYGAGHLDDLQSRLEDDFGLKHGETEWVTAWSLERKAQDSR